jgi:hypothetical protein
MIKDLEFVTGDVSHLYEDVGDISYEVKVTHEPALLNQYKLLRNKLYGIDERFVGFRIFNTIGAEDYDDPNHIMILLTNGNRCYGGARLTISTPQNPMILDLENDILPDPGKYYFSLRERLPELELHQYGYAECSRFALHPSLRTKQATRAILKSVLSIIEERRIRYLFCIGDRIRTRFYRQIFTTLNQPHMPQLDQVQIPMRPEYEGLKMMLLGGDTKHFHKNPETLLNPISESVEYY